MVRHLVSKWVDELVLVRAFIIKIVPITPLGTSRLSHPSRSDSAFVVAESSFLRSDETVNFIINIVLLVEFPGFHFKAGSRASITTARCK
jgi:hypothetical protein